MRAAYESPTRRASRGRTISNDIVNLGFVMLRNVARLMPGALPVLRHELDRRAAEGVMTPRDRSVPA